MFSLSGNTQSFGSSRSPHTAETELTSFDDQISLQINSEGGFSASLHPSELIRTLQSASTWTARATAAAILSNTSEALLKSLVELADSQTSSVASATAPSSALFSILKTWLAEALTISQTSTASPFGSNEATAEAVSCILQTLIKIPVDLKRIAASKIGHLVMKLHTKGSESSSGLSIQISEIYKTATRIVTLWKESKASKSTTQDVAIVESTVKSSSSSSSSLSATTSSSVSKSTTKMSSSSSSSLSSMSNTQSTVPTSLPFMATLSSSSKTKSPSAMDVDDDIVETSKKRPRSITKSEDVKGGGVATTSSSNTTLSSTTTSKKTKTDGEFIKLQEKYRSSYLYPYHIHITDTRLCA